MELLQKLASEARKVDEVLRLFPLVDSQRRRYLEGLARHMILQLPEREDQTTLEVDLGYDVANILAGLFGYDRAGENIPGRARYRDRIMAEERGRRDKLVMGLANSAPDILDKLIEYAARSRTLREFLSMVSRYE